VRIHEDHAGVLSRRVFGCHAGCPQRRLFTIGTTTIGVPSPRASATSEFTDGVEGRRHDRNDVGPGSLRLSGRRWADVVISPSGSIPAPTCTPGRRR
jgi:hypothetical protein